MAIPVRSWIIFASIPSMLGVKTTRGNAATTSVPSPVFSWDGPHTFDGSSDCQAQTEGAAADLPMSGPFTMMATISAPNPISNGGIIGWGNWGTSFGCNALRFTSTTSFKNYWWGDDLDSGTVSSLSDGNSHHIAATYDGSTKRLFFDYVEVSNMASSSYGNGLTDKTNFCIGQTNSAENFRGVIQDVRIWNASLSATDMQSYGQTTTTTTTVPTYVLAMDNSSVSHGGYQIEWIGTQGMNGVYIEFASPCTDITAVTFMYDSAQPAGTQSGCTWTVSATTRFQSPVVNGADLFSIATHGSVTPASVSTVSFPGYGTGCPGSGYTCADWLRINGPGTQHDASAYGDPHLSNIHGKKFDVHDGLHRLVHYPHGASESEALLKIDADASMMPGEQSCYNVFFTSAKISGKWVGNEVLLRHDDAPMGKKRFLLGMNGKVHDWSELRKDASNLKFTGTESVKVSTRLRNASLDTPGGDDVEFSIGHEHPVLVQVWASLGSNELTKDNDIQYLNLEVQNLPENTGGLLGLDSYNRPAGSKCGLTQKENGAIDSIDDLVGLAAGKHTKRLQYRISATTRK